MNLCSRLDPGSRLQRRRGEQLAGDSSFAGHPVVTVRNGSVVNGGEFVVANLVSPAETPANPGSIA